MVLLGLPGLGTVAVRRILGLGGCVDSGEGGDWRKFERALGAVQLQAMPRVRDEMERQWEELAVQGIHAVSVAEPGYPSALLRLLGDDAPVVLLCKGNLGLLDAVGVGFCGSREATEKGMATARDTAALLAGEGVNVVSGYAAGVDMTAHTAALAAGGTTTIVMAEGILRFRVKREIQIEWDPARTLVVSEFGANLPWSVSHAMTRNRTICGLSRAMVLIEARATGGSIQAGRDCLRLRLPLFAAVYEGMPESAVGNEQLLRDGGRRLMKSRSTGLPNVGPILEAIGDERAVGQLGLLG